ncbi:MAG: hypothetical protein EA422_12615 [Gemmatimonadales bacterium]|nr:MAG: hypothetical protein EA422_12615 [Gemmatimonadales bacterium]
MALEGPFLAAVIARLPDPTFNLAAYGVAFAFAILVESPVIMLMSASTALVEDAQSYRKLRRFANQLNVLSTFLLILLLIPPVFDLVLRTALGLPPEVADRVYGAFWLLLPWPAAIGYRRFIHGILIREGRTRWIAYGTGIRLFTMAATGVGLALAGLPGAWVGAGALSAGVVVEAGVAWAMSRGIIRRLLERESVQDDTNAPATPSGSGLETREIIQFYYPLALTSLLALTTQPLLTFFMGRAPAPVESLAVFPVVMALYFLFGTLGLSFQEAVIALVGRRGEHRAELTRFAGGLAVVASGLLAILAFTPMARVWFEGVSGLEPGLAALAFLPAQIVAIGPALSVVIGLQRGLLVKARRTRPITMATVIEVTTIAILFPLLGWGLGWMGVTAAITSLMVARTLGVAFLAWAVRRTA